MALYGIGKSRLKVILKQNGKYYECALHGGVQISREPNCPSKLTCIIKRDHITAEKGDIISVTLDDQHNQFKGTIIDVSKFDKEAQIVAYDQLYLMKESKIRYSYENITATQLIRNLINDGRALAVEPPHLMETEYEIPYRIEDNVSVLDIIVTALDQTYKYTGQRFYVWDDFGNLVLWSEQQMACITLKVSMDFLKTYDYKESLSDYYNYIRVEGDVTNDAVEEGQRSVFFAQDEEAIKKYGRFEYYQKLDEYENGDFVARQLLKEKCKDKISFSLSGVQGDIRVRGGTPIFVDFFSEDRKEYIRGWFRTTSVTHTIEDGLHTMDLSLELIEMYNDWSDPLYGKAIEV